MRAQKTKHSRIFSRIGIIMGLIVLFCLAIIQFPEESKAAPNTIEIVYVGGNVYTVEGESKNANYVKENYGITITGNKTTTMTIGDYNNGDIINLKVAETNDDGKIDNIVINGRNDGNTNIILEKTHTVQINETNNIGSITANDKNLTLTGTGSCETTGISAGSGNITFDNTGKITVTSSGNGIEGNNVNITSGTLNITTSRTDSKGISASSLTIGDKNNVDNVSPTISVSRTEDATNSGTNIGIYSSGDMTLHDGNITIGANGGNNYFEKAIKAGGKFIINNGTIDAIATNKGIEARSATINDGDIIIDIIDTGAYYNRGIDITSILKILGGNIDVTSEGSNAEGVYVGRDVNITDGYLEVEANGLYTKGIQVNGSLSVGPDDGSTQPTIIIQGDIRNEISNNWDESGMYVENSMTVNSGNIKVDIKNTKNLQYIVGILVKGAYTQKNGNVESNVDVLNTSGQYGHADGMCVHGKMTVNNGRLICNNNGLINNSAAIHVKTNGLYIYNGTLEFRNTNSLVSGNDNNTRNVGKGLYIESAVYVYGGHIIAQAMSNALFGTINLQNKVRTDNGKSMATLVSSDYEGKNLSMYNASNNITTYKYVEIGVAYDNYIRYDGVNNLYFGELTAPINDATLQSLGITKGANNGELILDNVNFMSKLQYGLKIEGSATIELKKDSINKITANTDTDGQEEYGIYCSGTLTIKGEGSLIVSGVSKAIYVPTASNVEYTDGTDYKLKPLCVSTTLLASEGTKNPSTVDYTTTKYIEIGPIVSYYLKYDAETGTMYKATSSTSEQLTTNNQLVYGWSINNKTLILNNFNFSTAAEKGLEIVGDAQVKIEGTNTISLIYHSTADYVGLVSQGDLDISGSGTLNMNIYNDTANKFTGISSTGNVSITNGTYNIEGTSYGIKIVDAGTLDIENSTMTIKGHIQAIYCNTPTIHESVQASADYTGTGRTSISHKASALTSYVYLYMVPEIISVDITWDALDYTGTGKWNPNTYTYEAEWRPTVDNADKITVQNTASNIEIGAQLQYNSTANITDTSSNQISNNIVGTLTNTADSTTIANTTINTINIGNTLSAQLSMSGTPTNDIGKQQLGTLTITITD